MNRKKSAKKRNESLLRALKFFVLLNAFAIPLYTIIILNLEFQPLKAATTDISFVLVKAIGVPATISGNLITIPVENGSWAGYIDWDCTGWKSMLLFFALVFATDMTLKRKIKCMIFMPVIYMVNILRITFMFWYVSAHGIENYPLIHATIWSWGMLLAVLGFWIFCVLTACKPIYTKKG